MNHIKIIAKYENREFKIKVTSLCRVCELQIKIRRYLQLNETEAIFMFFTNHGIFRDSEQLFTGSKLLIDIIKETNSEDVLNVTVLKENSFGEILYKDGVIKNVC